METKIHPRIERERKTLGKMIALYCREQHTHAGGTLCVECQGLLDYALERLDRCPFQEKKSTCAKCTVHCYRPEMRSKVRIVMRYAGPRMLLHAPGLAIMHLLDGRRKPPVLQQRNKRSK